MIYEEHIRDFYPTEETCAKHCAETIGPGADEYRAIVQSGLLPKYVNIRGITHRRSVDTGDELTHAEFLSLPRGGTSRRNVGQDARSWLFDLIHGRLRAYEERGRFPLLSIEEIIDEVGVDRPSPGQIDYARGIVTALFGQPKLFDGKDRWRVTLSFDHQTLDDWLRERFPLPNFDWERAFVRFKRPTVGLTETAAPEVAEVT